MPVELGEANKSVATAPQESASARPNYTLHESGHLFLNPDSIQQGEVASSEFLPASARGVRHPILDLIANATEEWCVAARPLRCRVPDPQAAR